MFGGPTGQNKEETETDKRDGSYGRGGNTRKLGG